MKAAVQFFLFDLEIVLGFVSERGQNPAIHITDFLVCALSCRFTRNSMQSPSIAL